MIDSALELAPPDPSPTPSPPAPAPAPARMVLAPPPGLSPPPNPAVITISAMPDATTFQELMQFAARQQPHPQQPLLPPFGIDTTQPEAVDEETVRALAILEPNAGKQSLLAKVQRAVAKGGTTVTVRT